MLLVWKFAQNSCGKTLTCSVMVFESRAFGRWLGHGGGVLMNGINTLSKEVQDRFLTLLATFRRGKNHLCMNQKMGLTRHWHVGALILDFLASKTVINNKSLLFTSFSTYDSWLQQLKWTERVEYSSFILRNDTTLHLCHITVSKTRCKRTVNM